MRMHFVAMVLALGAMSLTRGASFEAGVFRVDTTVYEYPTFRPEIYIGPEELHAHSTMVQNGGSGWMSQVQLSVNFYHKKILNSMICCHLRVIQDRLSSPIRI